MGAWGMGAFENDDASDWLAALDGAVPQRLRLTFERVTAIEPELYLEAPAASEAVAAAEVVTAMLGKPGPSAGNSDVMDGLELTGNGLMSRSYGWHVTRYTESERRASYATSGARRKSSTPGSRPSMTYSNASDRGAPELPMTPGCRPAAVTAGTARSLGLRDRDADFSRCRRVASLRTSSMLATPIHQDRSSSAPSRTGAVRRRPAHLAGAARSRQCPSEKFCSVARA